MTAARPWVGPRCRCGHAEPLHDRGQRCGVKLPAFLEEELPAWDCPCTGYAEHAGDLWRWDTASSSWRAA